MSDTSESEFKPDYEEDVPLPEVEWLKSGDGNTKPTPTVNKTRSLLDLPILVLHLVLDFAVSPHNYGDLVAVFKGHVGADYLVQIKNKIFLELTEEQKQELWVMRIPGVTYYCPIVDALEPARFGVNYRRLEGCSCCVIVCKHARRHGLNINNGELIFQVFGTEMALVGWVPSANLSIMKANY